MESGLGGREYAARLGVKEATLRHWKWFWGRERRRRRERGETKAAFLEVSPAVSAQLVGGDGFELVLEGERRLRIPVAFDEAALRRLLVLLGGG